MLEFLEMMRMLLSDIVLIGAKIFLTIIGMVLFAVLIIPALVVLGVVLFVELIVKFFRR